MTDLPPDRENIEPQFRHGPPRNDQDSGGRPHGRRRASRPPRIHERRNEDPTAPTIVTIEVGARPAAVPYHRGFRVHDTEWLAWVSGFGAPGTGNMGLGVVQTLHFALATDPDRPLREVLMPTGRLEDLFDEELLRLFADSREIRLPEPGAAPRRVRRRGEGLF